MVKSGETLIPDFGGGFEQPANMTLKDIRDRQIPVIIAIILLRCISLLRVVLMVMPARIDFLRLWKYVDIVKFSNLTGYEISQEKNQVIER